MNHPPDNEEVEVKFFNPDGPSICQRLAEMGAKRHARVFETNIRFDDGRQRLLNENKLLRLRKDDSCRLTFKSKPARESTDFKIYRELEIGVSDFDTTRAILEALGFREMQIYEKWRETHSWRDTEICIDTMPFGDFIEIEGPGESIRTAADRLGLEWGKRILHNYLSMFERIRQMEPLSFSDVTFENFSGHSVRFTSYLPLFQAEPKA